MRSLRVQGFLMFTRSSCCNYLNPWTIAHAITGPGVLAHQSLFLSQHVILATAAACRKWGSVSRWSRGLGSGTFNAALPVSMVHAFHAVLNQTFHHCCILQTVVPVHKMCGDRSVHPHSVSVSRRVPIRSTRVSDNQGGEQPALSNGLVGDATSKPRARKMRRSMWGKSSRVCWLASGFTFYRG